MKRQRRKKGGNQRGGELKRKTLSPNSRMGHAFLMFKEGETAASSRGGKSHIIGERGAGKCCILGGKLREMCLGGEKTQGPGLQAVKGREAGEKKRKGGGKGGLGLLSPGEKVKERNTTLSYLGQGREGAQTAYNNIGEKKKPRGGGSKGNSLMSEGEEEKTKSVFRTNPKKKIGPRKRDKACHRPRNEETPAAASVPEKKRKFEHRFYIGRGVRKKGGKKANEQIVP